MAWDGKQPVSGEDPWCLTHGIHHGTLPEFGSCWWLSRLVNIYNAYVRCQQIPRGRERGKVGVQQSKLECGPGCLQCVCARAVLKNKQKKILFIWVGCHVS